MAAAGGAYDEVLRAAAGLGFHVLGDAASGGEAEGGAHHQQPQTAAIQQAQALVQQCCAVHDLELRVAALAGALAARDVTDRGRLANRAGAAAGVAAALRGVCGTKDALADRLRSASTRPSVPVAPAYQPDFSALLLAAAGSAGTLAEGLGAVQWAVGLDARPSCWEDQLRGIREAAAGVRECLGGMREFDAALAAVAGGGGGAAVVAAAGGASPAAGEQQQQQR